MCELKRRNALNFHYDRTKMRFIKKSRWELPKQKSPSYWTDVCNNLERKARQVRDPISNFPFISHSNNNLDFDPHDSAEFNNLSKVQSQDEPIVKVSPPTPSRKSSFIFPSDDFQDINCPVNKKDTHLDENFIIKLQSLIEKKENVNFSRKENFMSDYSDFENLSIFSKKACPHHKNEPPPQIFDDDLKKYLPKGKFSDKSVYKHSVDLINLKKTCSLHHFETDKKDKIDKILEKDETETSLRKEAIITDDSKIGGDEADRAFCGIQKPTKAPKLGKASLLASFAKTVSIPSSVETHESSDEDNSKSDTKLGKCLSKAQSEEKFASKAAREEKALTSNFKDYLRVPKLGFASLHPSFRKLIPIDSFSNEEEDNSVSEIEYSFSLKKSKSDDIDDNSKNLVKKSSTFVNLPKLPVSKIDTKKAIKKKIYAYRALTQLTKIKDIEPCEEFKISRSSSSKSIKRQDSDSTNYKIMREKLKSIASKCLGKNIFLPSKESEEIKTILSSTRSTSGSSTKFQNTQFESKSFTKIPSIKIYPRKNADKCLPCLCKYFQKPEKKKCELPLAILSSFLRESPKELSESDESSVSLPDLTDLDLIPDLDLIRNAESRVDASKIGKDLIKIEDADDKSQISQESVLSKDHSLSPKSLDLKKVGVKSGSVQSTDVSKPSSPSGQSSESEEARGEVSNEALDISQNLAPCHAPLIWKPNLEYLRALRLRTATSMESRAAAIISKSLDDTDLEDSSDEEIPSPKEARKSPTKTVTIQSSDLKIDEVKESGEKSDDKIELRKRRKILARTKTMGGKIDSVRGAKKDRFIRARTSIDLALKLVDSERMSFDADDSAESGFNKDLTKLREDSKEVKLSQLSEDNRKLVGVLEKCLEDEKSSGEILKILCDWFATRNAEIRKSDTDPDLKGALKISLNLLRLLAESRRYLNSDQFSPDLEFSSQQPPVCNSRQLRRVLPVKLYNKVALILNLPIMLPKNVTEGDDVSREVEFKEKESTSSLSSDLIVHPPSDKKFSLDNRQSRSLNPYARFLRKPRRKAVIWRPLNEEDLKGYNPDASLHNRATKITDKICHDFCEWLREMSGPLERIDEEVLKDMFQIIFTAEACKSTKVLIKEMPTVPKPIALIRNSLTATQLEMTRKELIRDSKIESQPKKIFAFGTTLPKKLRFVTPKNQVKDKWLSCKNISPELETMEVVWNGIKHLKSTTRYADWVKTTTNLKVPEILKEFDVQTTVSLSKFSQEDAVAQEENEEKNTVYH